ncbi:MAG: ExbD/TolR family protein [Bacteroidia bacterium]
MADIQSNETSPKKGRRRDNRPAKIDMTPMVDLAFLLLTFFILATTLAKPRVMELSYPKESADHQQVKDSLANTLLLGEKDKLFYYHGMFKEGITELKPIELDKGGLRKLIVERNRTDIQRTEELAVAFKSGSISKKEYLESAKRIKEDPKAPYFILKTMEKTAYGKIVDVIDELQIGDVSKYVVVNMTDAEKAAMEKSRETAAL